MWYRGRYLHDGAVTSLEEMFNPGAPQRRLRADGLHPARPEDPRGEGPRVRIAADADGKGGAARISQEPLRLRSSAACVLGSGRACIALEDPMRVARIAGTIVTVALLFVPGAASAQSASAPVRGVDSLPSTIPLFPLDDLMVFPNILRPLHIFEPRYRAMVADALKGDGVIGMIQLRPGYEADYEGRPPVFAIGCAGVITKSEQLPDGRYNIVLRGLVKFRILSEDQSRPYRLARVEAIPENPDDQDRAALGKQRERLLALSPAGSEPPPQGSRTKTSSTRSRSTWRSIPSNARACSSWRARCCDRKRLSSCSG